MLKALKVLVVVMGIMIIAGLAVIAVELTRRISAGDDGKAGQAGTAEAPPAAATAAASAPFGRVDIDLPADSRIAETDIADGLIVVTARGARNGRTIIVLDPRRGVELGRFALTPAQ